MNFFCLIEVFINIENVNEKCEFRVVGELVRINLQIAAVF